MIVHSIVIYSLLFVITICIFVLIKLTRKRFVENYENSTKCVVYKCHKQGGFFSDFAYLMEAYTRAKRAGLPFYVDSTQWSYKINKGWHDYFKTLDELPKNNTLTPIYCEHSNVSKDIDGKQKMFIKDYENAAKEIFVLVDSIQKKIDDKRNEYGPYEAIYIRRGDKNDVESPYITTSDIISQTSFDNSLPLFVQTDDYKEITNIKQLKPDKKILTIVPEVRKGARESDRKTMTKQELEETTHEFFIGISLCIYSKKCYVDILSNVSRFIKVVAPNTTVFYKIGNQTINYSPDKEIITSLSYIDVFGF